MKPVWQTTFGGPDATVEERGNCFSACLASILDLPLAAVPNFNAHTRYDPKLNNWGELVDEFLVPLGLYFTEMGVSGREVLNLNPGDYVLTAGSLRGPWRHSVCGRLGRVVHDPRLEQGTLPKLGHLSDHLAWNWWNVGPEDLWLTMGLVVPIEVTSHHHLAELASLRETHRTHPPAWTPLP